MKLSHIYFCFCTRVNIWIFPMRFSPALFIKPQTHTQAYGKLRMRGWWCEILCPGWRGLRRGQHPLHGNRRGHGKVVITYVFVPLKSVKERRKILHHQHYHHYSIYSDTHLLSLYYIIDRIIGFLYGHTFYMPMSPGNDLPV